MGDQLTENIQALDKNINNIEEINDKIDTVIELTDKMNNLKIQETIVCGCGGHYVNRNKTRHMKTKKHLDYEEKVLSSSPSIPNP
jgi:prefoldin subunit 5